MLSISFRACHAEGRLSRDNSKPQGDNSKKKEQKLDARRPIRPRDIEYVHRTTVDSGVSGPSEIRTEENAIAGSSGSV